MASYKLCSTSPYMLKMCASLRLRPFVNELRADRFYAERDFHLLCSDNASAKRRLMMMEASRAPGQRQKALSCPNGSHLEVDSVPERLQRGKLMVTNSNLNGAPHP